MDDDDRTRRWREQRASRELVPFVPKSLETISANTKSPPANSTEEDAEMALSNAERQARWREKHSSNAVTVAENNAVVTVDNGAVPSLPAAVEPERVYAKPIATHESYLPKPERLWPRWNWPLAFFAFTLFGCATATNVWNVWGSDWSTTAIPLAYSVVAEGVLFLTIPVMGMGRWWQRLLAVPVCVLFLAFALYNSFRLSAVVAADVALARAERSTAGTAKADAELDKAKATRSRDCGPGQGASKACQSAQADVRTAGTKAEQARGTVVAAAKPEAKEFARFVEWASAGRWRPNETDFDNWGLLLRMVILQSGGLVLLLARR